MTGIGISTRFMNAFTVMLYGLGVLVFVAGLFADVWSWKMGIVGMVALWVVGFTLRVYTFTNDADEDFGDYEPTELYDR